MVYLFLSVLSALLLYTYLGYPLLLFLMARLLPRRHRIDERQTPSVTLIISAYNEAAVIERKLLNALMLDYPARLLRIMVVSDASSDGTDDIVRRYESCGVDLFRSGERKGKTFALNAALELVSSDLVVFSDANALYDRRAIRRLVRHFADDTVGYVVGHARYAEAVRSAAGASEGRYWDLEVKIKEWESTFSSVVGGDGAIYAIRRELYEPLRDTDINDFVNPLQIVVKGYRGVFDREAWCTERPAGDFQKEFNRKCRIANRSLNGVMRVPAACNPLRVGSFAWQLVSHKLLRWFSPFLLCAHLLSSLAALPANDRLHLPELFTGAYLLLALAALIGWWDDRRGRQRTLFYIPYYFTLMNMALAAGVLMRMRGNVISTWETARSVQGARRVATSLLPFMLVATVAATLAGFLHCFASPTALPHAAAYLLILAIAHMCIGYPAALTALAWLRPVRIERDENMLPEVTLLIVAYNEAQVIEEKILNSLSLDYPRHLLRIVVTSDGSTDATNDIVRNYEKEGIRLLSFFPNRGKIAALNSAAATVESEIIVFSDANVLYDHQAIRMLVRNFKDPRVGAVSGRVTLLNAGLSYGKSEDIYYSFEHYIQEMEGATGMMVGADGAMYAVRRELLSSPAADTLLDDFVISMEVARKGYLVIHERKAIAWERNVNELKGEFQRKVRIIAGGFQCLLRGNVVPSLSQPMLLFKFVSHKVMRWFSGTIMVILFCLLAWNYLLHDAADPVLNAAFYAMALACGVAAVAQMAPAMRTVRAINLVHYLFMLSLASLVGMYRELTGRQQVTWRREGA